VGSPQRLVWAEQYVEMEGQLHWRDVKDIPAPAELITSPYDTEVRYSIKRELQWVGYKVHFTETCEADTPNLIVNVETTPATTPDDNMVKVVHESLAQHDLLPSEHLVDKGYTDSHVLVESERAYGVTIVGPVAEDPSWQAREGTGFDKARFVVDWERQVVTCPAGKQSISWLPNTYPQNGMVYEAHFARKDCTPCQFRAHCTKAKVEPRIIAMQAREHYEALQAARKQQTTEEFRQRYAARAGVEGTHKACAGAGYGAHGILGWRRRISRTSSQRWRSISCGSVSGWRGHLVPKRPSLLSLRFKGHRRKVMHMGIRHHYPCWVWAYPNERRGACFYGLPAQEI
jgi:transposase